MPERSSKDKRKSFLPAMVAVWGIASRKVFLLYLSFSMMGLTLIFPLSYPGFHPGLLSHRP
jgi:hypothetical protein